MSFYASQYENYTKEQLISVISKLRSQQIATTRQVMNLKESQNTAESVDFLIMNNGTGDLTADLNSIRALIVNSLGATLQNDVETINNKLNGETLSSTSEQRILDLIARINTDTSGNLDQNLTNINSIILNSSDPDNTILENLKTIYDYIYTSVDPPTDLTLEYAVDQIMNLLVNNKFDHTNVEAAVNYVGTRLNSSLVTLENKVNLIITSIDSNDTSGTSILSDKIVSIQEVLTETSQGSIYDDLSYVNNLIRNDTSKNIELTIADVNLKIGNETGDLYSNIETNITNLHDGATDLKTAVSDVADLVKDGSNNDIYTNLSTIKDKIYDHNDDLSTVVTTVANLIKDGSDNDIYNNINADITKVHDGATDLSIAISDVADLVKDGSNNDIYTDVNTSTNKIHDGATDLSVAISNVADLVKVQSDNDIYTDANAIKTKIYSTGTDITSSVTTIANLIKDGSDNDIYTDVNTSTNKIHNGAPDLSIAISDVADLVKDGSNNDIYTDVNTSTNKIHDGASDLSIAISDVADLVKDGSNNDIHTDISAIKTKVYSTASDVTVGVDAIVTIVKPQSTNDIYTDLGNIKNKIYDNDNDLSTVVTTVADLVKDGSDNDIYTNVNTNITKVHDGATDLSIAISNVADLVKDGNDNDIYTNLSTIKDKIYDNDDNLDNIVTAVAGLIKDQSQNDIYTDVTDIRNTIKTNVEDLNTAVSNLSSLIKSTIDDNIYADLGAIKNKIHDNDDNLSTVVTAVANLVKDQSQDDIYTDLTTSINKIHDNDEDLSTVVTAVANLVKDGSNNDIYTDLTTSINKIHDNDEDLSTVVTAVANLVKAGGNNDIYTDVNAIKTKVYSTATDVTSGVDDIISLVKAGSNNDIYTDVNAIKTKVYSTATDVTSGVDDIISLVKDGSNNDIYTDLTTIKNKIYDNSGDLNTVVTDVANLVKDQSQDDIYTDLTTNIKKIHDNDDDLNTVITDIISLVKDQSQDDLYTDLTTIKNKIYDNSSDLSTVVTDVANLVKNQSQNDIYTDVSNSINKIHNGASDLDTSISDVATLMSGSGDLYSRFQQYSSGVLDSFDGIHSLGNLTTVTIESIINDGGSLYLKIQGDQDPYTFDQRVYIAPINNGNFFQMTNFGTNNTITFRNYSGNQLSTTSDFLSYLGSVYVNGTVLNSTKISSTLTQLGYNTVSIPSNVKMAIDAIESESTVLEQAISDTSDLIGGSSTTIYDGIKTANSYVGFEKSSLTENITNYITKLGSSSNIVRITDGVLNPITVNSQILNNVLTLIDGNNNSYEYTFTGQINSGQEITFTYGTDSINLYVTDNCISATSLLNYISYIFPNPNGKINDNISTLVYSINSSLGTNQSTITDSITEVSNTVGFNNYTNLKSNIDNYLTLIGPSSKIITSSNVTGTITYGGISLDTIYLTDGTINYSFIYGYPISPKDVIPFTNTNKKVFVVAVDSFNSINDLASYVSYLFKNGWNSAGGNINDNLGTEIMDNILRIKDDESTLNDAVEVVSNNISFDTGGVFGKLSTLNSSMGPTSRIITQKSGSSFTINSITLDTNIITISTDVEPLTLTPTFSIDPGTIITFTGTTINFDVAVVDFIPNIKSLFNYLNYILPVGSPITNTVVDNFSTCLYQIRMLTTTNYNSDNKIITEIENQIGRIANDSFSVQSAIDSVISVLDSNNNSDDVILPLVESAIAKISNDKQKMDTAITEVGNLFDGVADLTENTSIAADFSNNNGIISFNQNTVYYLNTEEYFPTSNLTTSYSLTTTPIATNDTFTFFDNQTPGEATKHITFSNFGPSISNLTSLLTYLNTYYSATNLFTSFNGKIENVMTKVKSDSIIPLYQTTEIVRNVVNPSKSDIYTGATNCILKIDPNITTNDYFALTEYIYDVNKDENDENVIIDIFDSSNSNIENFTWTYTDLTLPTTIFFTGATSGRSFSLYLFQISNITSLTSIDLTTAFVKNIYLEFYINNSVISKINNIIEYIGNNPNDIITGLQGLQRKITNPGQNLNTSISLVENSLVNSSQGSLRLDINYLNGKIFTTPQSGSSIESNITSIDGLLVNSSQGALEKDIDYLNIKVVGTPQPNITLEANIASVNSVLGDSSNDLQTNIGTINNTIGLDYSGSIVTKLGTPAYNDFRTTLGFNGTTLADDIGAANILISGANINDIKTSINSQQSLINSNISYTDSQLTGKTVGSVTLNISYINIATNLNTYSYSFSSSISAGSNIIFTYNDDSITIKNGGTSLSTVQQLYKYITSLLPAGYVFNNNIARELANTNLALGFTGTDIKSKIAIFDSKLVANPTGVLSNDFNTACNGITSVTTGVLETDIANINILINGSSAGNINDYLNTTNSYIGTSVASGGLVPVDSGFANGASINTALSSFIATIRGAGNLLTNGSYLTINNAANIDSLGSLLANLQVFTPSST